MDTGLILITFGLLATFHFMSVNVLKKSLKSLERVVDSQKGYWKSVEYSLEIQSNQISKEIQERGQFEEKAIGQLAQNIAALGYDIEKINGNIESSTQEINKCTKTEAVRIMFTPLKVKNV